MFSIFQYIWLQVSCSSDQTTNPETTNYHFFHGNEFVYFERPGKWAVSIQNPFWADQNKPHILWKKKSRFVDSGLGVWFDEQVKN